MGSPTGYFAWFHPCFPFIFLFVHVLSSPTLLNIYNISNIVYFIKVHVFIKCQSNCIFNFEIQYTQHEITFLWIVLLAWESWLIFSQKFIGISEWTQTSLSVSIQSLKQGMPIPESEGCRESQLWHTLPSQL